MSAVYKRELLSYFNSMIGYVYVAIVMVFIGLYFMAYNLFQGYPYFAYTLANTIVIFTIATPILTMKSMAEERKSKTDQMLLTYPVSVVGIVMGKFLALMTVFAVPLLISCICPIIISIVGSGYMLVDYVAIFAFLCMGCVFVSIGMFISSLTESQIIAAVASFGILLVLFLWPSLLSYLPSSALGNGGIIILVVALISLVLYNISKNILVPIVMNVISVVGVAVWYFVDSGSMAGVLASALSGFSCTKIYYNFAMYYSFDLGGLLFFASLTALFLFLTVQSVQKRRWS